MGDGQFQRSRLEERRSPIAIIRDGRFVYANKAYLKLFDLNDVSEVQGRLLANRVAERHQERLRDHLDEVERATPGQKAQPQAKLTLFKHDGDRFVGIARSRKVEFDDEECIQVELTTKEDITLRGTLKRHPWGFYFSLVFLLLFSAIPNLLLLKLDINNAPKVYFPKDEPAVVADNLLREKFPSDQVVVLLFEGVALFSDGFLKSMDGLAEDLSVHPLVDDVLALTRQDHITGSEDGFAVVPLIDIDNLDDTHPSERPEMVLADRFARQTLVSGNANAISMVVIPEGADNSLQRLQLSNDIRALVEKHRLGGYLTAVAGEVPVDVAELQSMLRDNMVFIPATTTIGLLLIWWLFRRILAVVIGGFAIGAVVSCTIAIYVVVQQPFTLIASITPPLLSALTIAALIHLFNAIHYASQRGLVWKPRVEKALEEIRRPSRFTALTTAAGLASLGTSPIPPIATFGMIAACGVVLIYFVVIVVIPPILIHWDHAHWPARRGGLAWMDKVVSGLSKTGIRHPAWVLGVTVIVLAAGIPQIRNIKVETNLQEFFLPSHEVRRSTDRIDEILVGTMPVDVSFVTTESNGLKRPENLRQIKAFQEWAETLPEVDKSLSMVDFVEEMNWGFNEEKAEFRRIPDNRDLISQYLFIYDGNDLYDLVDRDFQTTRVNLNLNVHSANDISKVLDAVRGYLEQNIDGAMTWDIAGVGRLFSDMEELLVRGQVYSLGGALVLIMVLMLVLWRSVWQALLCMVPNLSPIVLIFIVMGVFGIWLDMATAMIASVAVGIAVDDTIHVFHGFIHRVKQGVKPATALIRTYGQAGRAVMTTTIILTAQFMVLLISQFVPTGNFGLLTSIGLMTALLFDLMVLPAILIIIYNRSSGKGR
ncbi:MAG: MMPL family transporter [Sedimenticola sp.]